MMVRKRTAGVLLLVAGLALASCKTVLTDKTEYETGWELEHTGGKPGRGKKTDQGKTSANAADKTAAKPPVKPDAGKTGITNTSLKKEVDQWLGVPYKYGGTTKQGVDCSGFCGNVFKNVYNVALGRSAQDIFDQTKPVTRAALREGDLVFFKINSSRVSHVGIYLTDNKFVHASTSRGVMISDLAEAYWTKYYFASGRVPR